MSAAAIVHQVVVLFVQTALLLPREGGRVRLLARTHNATSGFRGRVVSNDRRDAPWPRVPATEGVEQKGDRRQFIARIRPGFAA
jgi:hypothetical protein